MNVRTVGAALAISVALAACGGDDEANSSGTVAPPTGDDAVATTTVDGVSAPSDPDAEPVPTIAPDVPDAFLPGVGPVAIVGERLPDLPEPGDDPAVGTPAPILVGETFDGGAVRVDATVDGPTWVVFLAHWCPHCNDEIPVINQLRDDGLIPDGINVVGVSTAVSPDRPNWPPAEWLDQKDWTFTTVADGIDTAESTFIAAAAFGLTGFPFSVLIDADGDVAARWSGGREPAELVSLLNTHLGTT